MIEWMFVCSDIFYTLLNMNQRLVEAVVQRWKITGKHLCQSLLLNKIAWGLQLH